MATEKRLIDANDLGRYSFHIMCEGEDGEAVERCVVDWDDIETAPTVDAVEVVHGRWAGYHEADIGYDEYGVRCSNCNFEVEDHEVDYIMNYCPNCGAKMDGGTYGSN